MLRDLLFRLRALLLRRTVDGEIDDELRFHRERQLAAYEREGLSAAEARRRLAIEFGGLGQVKESVHDAHGISWLEHLARDVRYAVRSLARTPAFTMVAAATIALGIGANIAIFSVVYGLLLRPLPYANPSGLIVLRETTPKVGEVSVSYPNFVDWRAGSRAFAAMSVVADLDVDLGGVSQPEMLGAEAVSSDYLPMLGVRPAIGRAFTADEDRAGTAPVAILTYALWQQRFGGDRGLVGRTITLDRKPVTVVGVLPADFRGLQPISVLEPIGTWLTGNDGASERGSRGDTTVVARLAAGATIDSARAEMDGIAARLSRAYPDTNAGFGVALRPLRDVFVGNARPALLVLFGAALCVLLIACANVANLLLIRGASRTHEIALRIAIGAGRRRIVAQLLTESTLLAGAGGLLGLGVAAAGSRALARMLPSLTMGGADVGLNGAVLAFAAATVIVSTLVFGLAPALQASRARVSGDLAEGGRSGTAGRGQRRWRSALAISEVALALVLLVGAGLMMRSLSRLLAVDAGIRTDHVVALQFELRAARYEEPAAVRRFWQQLVDGTARLPGVETVALGSGVPLTDDHSRRDISIDGQTFESGGLPHPDVHVVTPAYAAALGIRLRRGRLFTDADTARAPRVGLVNRSLAERYFAGADPVGRRFAFGRPAAGRVPSWITIAGVVEDTRLYGLDSPSRLEVYLPLEQSPRNEMTLLVKSAVDPAALIPAVRSIAGSIDPDQPIASVSTMNELRDASMSTRQVTFLLLALFSGLALTLAAIGIYGVMSYGVALRVRELSIRVALGARRGDVLRTVLAQGFFIAGAGIAIGVGLALVLTRLMRTLLFEVGAGDPATFLLVAAAVALCATVACALPGWRALRVDPLIALRQQ